MKKITEFVGRACLDCSYNSARRLAIIIALCLLSVADITGAAAQTGHEMVSQGKAVAKTRTNALANYALTTMNAEVFDDSAMEPMAEPPIALRLYPDPVSDYLLVMLPTAAAINMLVTIVGMDGNILATDTIATGATNTVIDMKAIRPGTYVISVDDVVDKQALRLVKK